MFRYLLSLGFLLFSFGFGLSQVKDYIKISDLNGFNATNALSDGDFFGRSVVNIGDLDGDGVSDFAIGANMSDEYGINKGAVYILFMNGDNSIKRSKKISSLAGDFFGIIDDDDLFGTSLSELGDLDGDGVVDIAVGARLDDDGTTDAGAIWILFLKPDGTVKNYQKISSNTSGFNTSLTALASFGTSIANLGDLDGDQVIDIAVGANRDNSVNNKTGATYILFLNTNGTVKSYTKIGGGLNGFSNNLSYEDYFGSAVENIGDMDGDGVTDIAVGATHDDEAGIDAGAFYVILLNHDGTVKGDLKITVGLQGFSGPIDANGKFGASFANVGDQNDDGINEFIVGNFADNENGNHEGAIWLISIDSDINVVAETKISSSSPDFNPSISANSYFGCAVTNAGDLDGNGIDDILVGAGTDDDGGLAMGSAWILFLNDCIAIAGEDQELLCNQRETHLDATHTSAKSRWIIVNGQGDFEDAYSPATKVSNLAFGHNTFIWEVTNNSCVSVDTITVVTYEQTFADAGVDINLCDTLATNLNASIPAKGYGQWSLISGFGTIENKDLNISLVENLGLGKNIFEWTVTNGNCETADQISITTYENPKPIISQSGNILTTNTVSNYQWFFNGDSIQNETSNMLEIDKDGIYEVAVAYGNGCVRYSEQFDAIFTGLGNTVDFINNFKVYPNPGNKKIVININLQSIVNYSIKLINVHGRIIESRAGNSENILTQFNTASLSNGIYFLRFTFNKEEFIQKVVINH